MRASKIHIKLGNAVTVYNFSSSFLTRSERNRHGHVKPKVNEAHMSEI